MLVVGPAALGGAASAVGLPAGSGLLPLESLPSFGAEPVDPTRMPATPQSPLAACCRRPCPAIVIGPEELPTPDNGRDSGREATRRTSRPPWAGLGRVRLDAVDDGPDRLAASSP
ncbi:MAG: hypothetical protein U0R72_00060 [Nakamurella multipartita]